MGTMIIPPPSPVSEPSSPAANEPMRTRMLIVRMVIATQSRAPIRLALVLSPPGKHQENQPEPRWPAIRLYGVDPIGRISESSNVEIQVSPRGDRRAHGGDGLRRVQEKPERQRRSEPQLGSGEAGRVHGRSGRRRPGG